MKIEEKAKAYDEALERAKKELKTCGSLDCDAAKQIIRFFPELHEWVRGKALASMLRYVESIKEE